MNKENESKTKSDVGTNGMDNLPKVLAILELERRLTNNMKDFGWEGLVTITDFTRQLTADERQKLYNIIDEIHAITRTPT